MRLLGQVPDTVTPVITGIAHEQAFPIQLLSVGQSLATEHPTQAPLLQTGAPGGQLSPLVHPTTQFPPLQY